MFVNSRKRMKACTFDVALDKVDDHVGRHHFVQSHAAYSNIEIRCFGVVIGRIVILVFFIANLRD